MKKIFAIAWKDAVIRFASSSELLFFIILPLVFTFLIAGGVPSGDDDNRIRLVVVDQAANSISQEIITELNNSTAVRPDVMSLEDAEDEFDSRNAAVVLVIPSDLDLKSIQNGTAQLDLRQQPNNLDASIAQRAIQTAVRRVTSAVNAANLAVEEAEARGTFESSMDEQAYFDEAFKLAKSLQEKTLERVDVIEGRTEDQVDYDPRANTSAGQLITWVFIPLLGISGLFAYERQQGTLRRVLTTPTSKATFLFGTITGQVVMALVQMTLLILFGRFAFGLHWGNPFALALILICSALAAAALGTTMGAFIKTEGQATGLSVMLGMVMAMMGGCWYPIELFPTVVQTIVKILPTTWAMQGLLDLVLRGGGLVDILPEAGVLLAFAAVFFSIGVIRFRYE
jgi:ABC-2 type transport system permease protein